LANVALGYRNRVTGATVTSDSERTGNPASNAATAQPSQVWRSASGTTAAYLQVDFGASVAIGAIAAINTNVTSAGTIRYRLSDNADMSSAGYDSTALESGTAIEYRLAANFLPSTVTRRYLRVDFSDATLSFVDCGKLFAGPSFRPAIGYQFGIQRLSEDMSRRFKSEDGNDYVLRGTYRRGVAFTMPAVTTTEWENSLEPLIRLSGLNEDVLVCVDPSSTNIGRDTYVGLMDEMPAWERNFPGYGTTSFRVWHRV
jgi:hypothetical protein